MIIAIETQFHIYLQWGQCPSRGLLRDCHIFGNLRITFVWSSTMYTSSCSWSWRHAAASPPAINDTNQWYLGEILGPRSEILEILGPRSPGSCYNCYIELLAWARVKCDTLFDRRKQPSYPSASSKHPNLTLQCPQPSGLTLELQTKVWNHGECPYSWLKVATTTSTFKKLLRHYAKRGLTPW